VCIWDWEREGNQLLATGILQSDPPGGEIDYQHTV
jgi:cilia- and flagella-associated protein 251